MSAPDEVVGAVLVGGSSRRMGTDKARLELGGRSLAARAVAALQAHLERVVVVSRRPGEHADLGVPEIADRVPGAGPLAGLHAALDHARPAAVFVLACDLPNVGPPVVAHLLERARSRPRAAGAAWAVVPAIGSRTQPLCGVYGPGCGLEVERRLGAGQRRALDLLEAIDAERCELGPELAFYREDLLDNVNDPRAAARLGLDRVLAPE